MSKRFKETANEILQSQEADAFLAKLQQLRELPDGVSVAIPIELIDRNQNIRESEIDRSSLEFRQLVEGIREVGILHNPVITILGEKIVCVAGHRRLAALEELGEVKPNCILRHFEKLEKKQVAQLLENVARKALSPLEIADQLAKLQKQGYSQSRLEELLGKDRKTIGRYQKIASWPEDAKAVVRAYPDRLGAGFLLQIASRYFSNEELMKLLKIRAGIISHEEPMPPKQGTHKLLKKAETYFLLNKFSVRDCDLIRKVLGDLLGSNVSRTELIDDFVDVPNVKRQGAATVAIPKHQKNSSSQKRQKPSNKSVDI